ncbi:N-methyl-L-tryptophan oxidase [soil metagenome]
MESLHFRNVVLGGGAMGTATAYQLARRGEPVLLVEQFWIGHDRGSSHGVSRIIRHSYADARYTRLMPEAFRAWRRLEADAGQLLYIRTGAISACPPGSDYVRQVAEGLEALEIPFRRMTGADLRRAMPAYEGPTDDDFVFEPDAGILPAGRILATQVELAQQLGGSRTTILKGCPIRRIDLEGDHPVLLSDSVRITADRLIVVAGAWVSRLLPGMNVPLQVTRQQVHYFLPEDVEPFQIGRFPVYIYKSEQDHEAFYGLPAYPGTLVKFARHAGIDADPDHVDRAIDQDEVALIRTFLKGRLPALADAEMDRAEVCLYTVSPDEGFLVGPIPGREDVFVASACSGHGFKFSCLIGEVLAELAINGATRLDIGLWSLQR